MQRIAILAGGGRLPLMLAQSIEQQGGRAHIVAVAGEAERDVEAFPHTWVTWGALNRMIATLKRESDGTMMIAGSVKRPDLLRLKPDLGLLRYLPKALAMLRGGDDAVLTRVIRFFEAQGLTVKGVADVAPELLAAEGTLGTNCAKGQSYDADVACGMAVLDALANLDVGQAVVIENQRILAIEGVEGTDAMLARVGGLPGRNVSGGVLVKGPKRGQELRVDLPTVGSRTISALEVARVPHLVVASGMTLLLEREEMLRRAATAGISIEARPSSTLGAVGTPPSMPIPHGASRSGVQNKSLSATVLGRRAPSRSNTHDIRIATEVLRQLASFDSASAAVVRREHVLAIASAEGMLAMANRVAALRQWGRAFRPSGVAALRLDARETDGRELAQTIEALARAGLAGAALLTADLAPSVPSEALAMADAHGLFLVALSAKTSDNAQEAA